MKILDHLETVTCQNCNATIGLENGDVFVMPAIIEGKGTSSSIQCIACKSIQPYFPKKISPVLLRNYQHRDLVVTCFVEASKIQLERHPDDFVLVYVTQIMSSSRGCPDVLISANVCADYHEALRLSREIPSSHIRVGDDCDRVYSKPVTTYAISSFQYDYLKLDKVCLPDPPEYYGIIPFVKPEKSS